MEDVELGSGYRGDDDSGGDEVGPMQGPTISPPVHKGRADGANPVDPGTNEVELESGYGGDDGDELGPTQGPAISPPVHSGSELGDVPVGPEGTDEVELGSGYGAEEDGEDEGGGPKQGPFIKPPVHRELGRVVTGAVELRNGDGKTGDDVGLGEAVVLTTQGPVIAPLVHIEMVSVRLLPVGTIVRDVRFVVGMTLLVELDSGETRDVAVELLPGGVDELDRG